MDINIETIIIIILGLMLLIYTWNDYIMPFLTGTPAANLMEGFTSQYSSLGSQNANSGHSQTAAFDTNWYLRDPNKPIILNNQIALPVISYGFYETGGYDELIGTYFRHHVYPIEPQQLTTGLDTIYKFINGDIDIAFVNEELLSRFIKKDCKYLTRYIIDTLGLKSYDLKKQENIDRLYPPVNFSAIGVGFHVHPFLIVNNFSNIIQFMDIQNKSIGVLEDSYYYFIKICAAYQVDIPTSESSGSVRPGFQIERHVHLEDLFENFKTNKYDAIFIVLHPKNKQLLKLSLDMKLRYIHIQKRDGLDARNNLSKLIPDQQGTNNKTPPPPPDMNRQQIYSNTLIADLTTENIKESFNSLINKYFQHLKPHTTNLNKFYKSGNLYSYLETYSTRMILIIRNDIPEERQKYITKNYIDNLNRIRDKIDRGAFTVDLHKSASQHFEFTRQIDNFSSLEFKYEELLGFDNVIPLAPGARNTYISEGLIYFEDDARCQL
jgi:hypothetical protein